MLLNPIRKQLIHKKDEEVISLLNRLQFSLSTNLKEFEAILIINEKIEMKINKKVLSENSEYFKSLFNGCYKESDQNRINIEETEVEVFRLYIKLLHGDVDHLDAQTVIPLLRMADKYQSKVLLEKLPEFLLLQDCNLKKNLLNIDFEQSSLPDNVLGYIEEHLLAKKLTHKNLLQYTEIANKLNLKTLKEKCIQYATLQINDVFKKLDKEEVTKLFNDWKDCFGNLFTSKFNSINIFIPYFRLIYEISSLDEELKKRCLEFCQNNKDLIRERALWEVGETPAEILAIYKNNFKFS